MSEELLKDIKGQLLMLRNDILLMQHSIDKMNQRITELAKRPEPTTENKVTDQSLQSMYGENTRIEKF